MSLIRAAGVKDCFVSKGSQSANVTFDIFDIKGNKIGTYTEQDDN